MPDKLVDDPIETEVCCWLDGPLDGFEEVDGVPDGRPDDADGDCVILDDSLCSL